jgi:hypothetical protein
MILAKHQMIIRRSKGSIMAATQYRVIDYGILVIER